MFVPPKEITDVIDGVRPEDFRRRPFSFRLFHPGDPAPQPEAKQLKHHRPGKAA
jgi:hypothetical protein